MFVPPQSEMQSPANYYWMSWGFAGLAFDAREALIAPKSNEGSLLFFFD